MSVLIRGMEMPTTCRDCRFCNGQADTDYGVCAWCDVDGNAHDAYTMQDCPLIHVPPHGDLIDRDKLYEKTAEWEAQALHMVEVAAHENTTEWRKWSTVLTERSAFKFDVADAPTIIPAEEGE